MKTYVIILSEKFPTTHPKKGHETEFGSSFLNGKKIHTIRGNFPLWEKRLKEVQEGHAVLSIRQWEGKPYRSKQVEIAQLTAADDIGIERLTFDKSRVFLLPNVNYKPVGVGNLANNDGLSLDDWKEWFKDYDLSKPMAIIHFTKFRY